MVKPPEGLVREGLMTEKEEQRVLDDIEQIKNDVAILMKHSGFLRSPIFWTIIGSCFLTAIGSYGYTTHITTTVTKELKDAIVINDNKRENDKDAIRQKLDVFNTGLISKIDMVLAQNSDIKCTMASSAKQVEMDTLRILELERKINK